MNRALLVGINAYPGIPLRGCVNDIKNVAAFLSTNCGFAKNDIRLLADERATTQAILDRMAWLIDGAQPGDRLVFQFSGHGSRVGFRNDAGSVDSQDEIICPVDIDWTESHMI